MVVFEYATSPIGIIHLIRQAGWHFDGAPTLCGMYSTKEDWTYGDETLSGIASTCHACYRNVRTMKNG